MNPLEEQLKELLSRKDPPVGFEERVLSRLSMLGPKRRGFWKELRVSLFVPHLRWAMASLLVVVMMFVGIAGYLRQRRIRAEGELAKTQVMVALQIASSKLNYAQKTLLDRSNRLLQKDSSRE